MFNIYLRSFASKMQVLKTSYNCDDFILQFNWVELLRGDFFASKPYLHFFIFFFFLWKILVRADKYLLQLGSREPQEKFSYANKVWFTVMSIIRKPLKLLKIYVVLTMICLWSWYSSKFNLCYQYKNNI